MSEGLHKTIIELNEEGCEAAAVTAIVMEITSTIHKPETIEYFRADHPFVFFLRDNINKL